MSFLILRLEITVLIGTEILLLLIEDKNLFVEQVLESNGTEGATTVKIIGITKV